MLQDPGRSDSKTATPGELASCFDSTIRIVADRLGIGLRSLAVEVAAELDVRGTLLVDDLYHLPSEAEWMRSGAHSAEKANTVRLVKTSPGMSVVVGKCG